MDEREIVMKALGGYFQGEKEKRLKNLRQQNRYIRKGQILFTGSSLMEQFPICEYCENTSLSVYNRGIGGYTTDEFIAAIDDVLLDLQPSKLFINIGTNDIRPMPNGESWLEHLTGNYRTILEIVRAKLPDTDVYLLAYYPVNGEIPQARQNPVMQVRTNENIALANGAVKELAQAFGYHYLDLNAGLTDTKGNLKAEYTMDGIHMYAEAYRIVFEQLKPYI